MNWELLGKIRAAELELDEAIIALDEGEEERARSALKEALARIETALNSYAKLR